MAELNWKVFAFKQLTANTLYNILAFRNAIFVVEQRCPYQDIDGADLDALHLMAYDNNHLIAYARVLPTDTNGNASIGRVIVDKDYRLMGIGHELIERAKRVVTKQFPMANIKISAQVQLIDFYKTHGFDLVNEAYLDDGIPHQDMIIDNSAE